MNIPLQALVGPEMEGLECHRLIREVPHEATVCFTNVTFVQVIPYVDLTPQDLTKMNISGQQPLRIILQNTLAVISCRV